MITALALIIIIAVLLLAIIGYWAIIRYSKVSKTYNDQQCLEQKTAIKAARKEIHDEIGTHLK